MVLSIDLAFAQTSAGREQVLRILRQQIEAMPLSREDKDRLLEQQLRAMGSATPQEQRWTNAREIHYRIIGEYKGSPALDPTAEAYVQDRVQIEFTLNAKDGKLVDKDSVAIRNQASELRDLQANPKGCLVPQLKGHFEFYTLEAVAPLLEGGPLWPTMTVSFRREFPAMTVANACIGKKSQAAHVDREQRTMMVPVSSQFLQQKSDRIVVKDLGWTWTYEVTPH